MGSRTTRQLVTAWFSANPQAALYHGREAVLPLYSVRHGIFWSCVIKTYNGVWIGVGGSNLLLLSEVALTLHLCITLCFCMTFYLHSDAECCSPTIKNIRPWIQQLKDKAMLNKKHSAPQCKTQFTESTYSWHNTYVLSASYPVEAFLSPRGKEVDQQIRTVEDAWILQ
jgi:hypothetical protein